jgi:anti-sigma factor RsiW
MSSGRACRFPPDRASIAQSAENEADKQWRPGPTRGPGQPSFSFHSQSGWRFRVLPHLTALAGSVPPTAACEYPVKRRRPLPERTSAG